MVFHDALCGRVAAGNIMAYYYWEHNVVLLLGTKRRVAAGNIMVIVNKVLRKIWTHDEESNIMLEKKSIMIYTPCQIWMIKYRWLKCVWYVSHATEEKYKYDSDWKM